MKQLTKIHQCQEVIKKSTFIAIIAPITHINDVQEFLDQYSNFDATHNCWAYNIGFNYRFNDDGEPSGTAGKPILNTIQGQDFDNTIALVIRHYGGIKLGTGGLMRAYGGGVSRALQSAEFQIIQSYSELQLKVPFQYIQAIHNLNNSFQASITNENFNQDGADIGIKLLSKDQDEYLIKTTNLSKGQIIRIISD